MSILSCLILTLIGILIFVVYNSVVIGKFGVPSSLSASFYLWNGVKKNLGYIFTGMMFAMAFCLMPGWLEITAVITPWSHYLTVLPAPWKSSLPTTPPVSERIPPLPL